MHERKIHVGCTLRSFCVIVILLIGRHGCTIFNVDQEEDINEIIHAVMGCKHIPGLSISVVKGEKAWNKGFGVSDIPTGSPADEHTAFLTGSLGKSFTMTLLGMLLQENGYNWDSKLTDIEGLDLQFFSEELTREMTLADMLSHRTGLSIITDYAFIGQYPDKTTIAEISQRAYLLPKHAEFRSNFLYNNMMYVLCAHVTEVLGRKPWKELITSRIFEPIGMTSTHIMGSNNDVYEEDVAKPYVYKHNVMQNGTFGIYMMTPLEPAGITFSTAEDMSRWMKFNLNQGRTDSGRQLIEPTMLQDAFQIHNPIPSFLVNQVQTPKYPVNDTTTGYGYAWFISEYRGRPRVWHSGGLFAYVSLIWLFPDDNIGIYASMNGPGIPADPMTGLFTIFAYLSDILLSEHPWLDVVSVCTYPSPWYNDTDFKMDKPPKYNFTNLEDFVGRFGNYLFPDVDIVLQKGPEGKGQLRLNMNLIQGDLLPQSQADTFAFNMTDPWEYAIERYITENITVTYPVTFIRDVDDAVESFNLFIHPINITFSKGIRFDQFPGSKVSNGANSAFLSNVASGSLLGHVTLLVFLGGIVGVPVVP